MADWLDAAKQAVADAERERPGSAEEQRLLQIADTHARIATAEAVRALIGVLASMPIEDGPT